MCRLTEAVTKQGEIIRIQSEVIDELFLLLLQHITVEEADGLGVVDKINSAARIRAELE